MVDGYGTFGQAREVSYDIMGFDCNEPESRILSNTLKNLKFKDLKRCWMNRYNKRKNVYFILQV